MLFQSRKRYNKIMTRDRHCKRWRFFCAKKEKLIWKLKSTGKSGNIQKRCTLGCLSGSSYVRCWSAVLRSAVLSAPPTHGHGNRELGVYTGSGALCSHRLYKIPWDDRREILVLVGVGQERDPPAEISGLLTG